MQPAATAWSGSIRWPTCDPSRIDQVIPGVVSAFKKLHDSWGPRLEGRGAMRTARTAMACAKRMGRRCASRSRPRNRASQLVLLHCFGRSNHVNLMLTHQDVPRRPRFVALAEARNECATEALEPCSGAGHAGGKPFFRGLDSDVMANWELMRNDQGPNRIDPLT
jgi:hypothetical protein